MEALCRLTLKQEEELQLIRTEKQFLLHMESGPQGMLKPLWEVAQAWKAGKAKTPPTVNYNVAPFRRRLSISVTFLTFL